VGDTDRFFAVGDVTKTADALKQAGIAVQFEIIKNHDHNYYVIADKVNAWAWAALKGQALESEPQYTPRVFR